MLDITKYRDIAPYQGKDFGKAINKLIDNPKILYAFASALFPKNSPKENLDEFVSYFQALLKEVHCYDEFQRKITAGMLIPSVLKSSSDGFSISGIENLDKTKSYLYISNHRDIILDCALLDYALFLNDFPICEMAIGDNLTKYDFASDLLRLNGGVVVKRSLSMREKYLETLRLSEYFVSLVESGKSLWIAQKSGRSKDGFDITHSAIIKMLYLSQKKRGITFSELISNLNIVPVAISYEKDPNDINKARENYSTAKKGEYNKRELEDTISMLNGMKKDKGRIHISIGKPLCETYESPDEVALEIDRQIHSMYKLWPVAWFSYDYLNNISDNKDKYSDFDSASFLVKYQHLNDEVRKLVLYSYANPVVSYLKSNS